jgi:hypothetical protein
LEKDLFREMKLIKRGLELLLAVFILTNTFSCSKNKEIRILIFSKTAIYTNASPMYRHESIET